MRDNELPRAYYNEIDPYAAQWLRNLIDGGHIAPGDVDQRSIVDVKPDDLIGYTQCHFFAGIGGWSYGARLAGWPDERPLWTGSCPCQPFSVSGRKKGKEDERHLWPILAQLIRARRPDVIMGEQVAAAVGQDWLDGVFVDMEDIGYACGAAVIPACSVDAPHRRDRLWFVAHSIGTTAAGWMLSETGQRSQNIGGQEAQRERFSDADTVGRHSHGNSNLQPRWWSTSDAVAGPDGKSRRVEPGTPLLAHGVSNRVEQLRAYGNAIVPQVAAEVIAAYMEI